MWYASPKYYTLPERPFVDAEVFAQMNITNIGQWPARFTRGEATSIAGENAECIVDQTQK